VKQSNLIPFKFQNTEIRVVKKDGDFLFVAQDICKGLDIANYRDAVVSLNKNLIDAGIKGVVSTDTLLETAGGKQNMLCVTEAGLNLLVMQSRKASAMKFKFWLASEVLPSIRKTGSYTLPEFITPAQQHAIQQAVTHAVHTSEGQRNYASIYGAIKREFKVGSYKQLSPAQFDKAVAFIGGHAPNHNNQARYIKQKYSYPRELGLGDNIIAGNCWLTAQELLSEKYSRPIGLLLKQLQNDGHDVDGAVIEYLALRDRVQSLSSSLATITSHVNSVITQGMRIAA